MLDKNLITFFKVNDGRRSFRKSLIAPGIKMV
jgi:hypothetical protein